MSLGVFPHCIGLCRGFNGKSTVYKPTSFFYHIERFHNTLPAASMKVAGGGCSLTIERGGLKVYGLLSREGRAFMIAPLLWGLTSTDAETSSA